VDHDDLENEDANPETKVYPDDMKPDKVTYEGYVESGVLDLPSFEDDDPVLLEPSVEESPDDTPNPV